MAAACEAIGSCPLTLIGLPCRMLAPGLLFSISTTVRVSTGHHISLIMSQSQNIHQVAGKPRPGSLAATPTHSVTARPGAGHSFATSRLRGVTCSTKPFTSWLVPHKHHSSQSLLHTVRSIGCAPQPHATFMYQSPARMMTSSHANAPGSTDVSGQSGHLLFSIRPQTPA